MTCTHEHRIVFVVYDGIENSVFQSQVLHPLVQRLHECAQTVVTLISFEARNVSSQRLLLNIPQHDRLRVVLLRRARLFFGWGIAYAVKQLIDVLPLIEGLLIARGPLAGVIALRAFPGSLVRIIVQARGLCAEEYRYAHKDSAKFMYWWHRLRYQQFFSLEHEVYQKAKHIEAVSEELKQFLIKRFEASTEAITLASHDIPPPIGSATVIQWRQQARSQLGISHDAKVYCYNGSYKPWQCAQESVAFVAQAYRENPNIFLLVLSQDKELFLRCLAQSILPPQAYCVVTVPTTQLLFFLAAADIGLLFRDPDVINWVSRPTKLLEYRSVGLAIEHNNTVAYCVK